MELKEETEKQVNSVCRVCVCVVTGLPSGGIQSLQNTIRMQ